MGIFDKIFKKKEVVKKYEIIREYPQFGITIVKHKGKYGIVDKTGKEIVPCKYDNVWYFSEGLARVKQNGKCGYIDETGKEIIPCKFDNALRFSEGLAAVKQNGKSGFIDKTGKEIVPCKYEDVGSFHEGLACVKQNGKYGYIDKTGKEIVPCKYYDLEILNNLRKRVQKKLEERILKSDMSFMTEELLDKDFMEIFKSLYKSRTVKMINNKNTTEEEAVKILEKYQANIKEINIRMVQVIPEQEKLAELKSKLIAKLDEVENNASKGKRVDD